MEDPCFPETGASTGIPVLKHRAHLRSNLALVSYPLFSPGMCLDGGTFVLAYLSIVMFTKEGGGKELGGFLAKRGISCL